MTETALPVNQNPEPEDRSSEDTRIEDGTQEDVQKAVRKLAEKRPEMLFEMMGMEMSSIGNPLHQKMTAEHISQVLDLAAKHDERQFELHKESQKNDFSEGKSNKLYSFAAFVLVLGLTMFVLYRFEDKPDLLVPILTGLGGLIGGFLGGWGFGTKQK